MPDVPYRHGFWNIGDERVFLYILAAIMAIAVAYGVSKNYRLWMIGKPEFRANDLGARLRHLWVYGLGQRRTSRNSFAGTMHAFIYGGFFVLTIVTIMESLEYYGERLFGFSYLRGPVYLGYSLVGDFFGVILLVGLGMAAYRRFSMQSKTLVYAKDDTLVLLALGLATFSGYFAEGARIAVTELAQHPDWAIWSPVGYVFALVFSPLGEANLLIFHRVAWFVHLLCVMGVLTYVGYSKLSHILFGPLNIFFYQPKSGAALKPIGDFEALIEAGESLGVARVEQFSWKQLLDSSACIKCGRCTGVCPATASGKPLDPKKIILDVRAQLYAEGPRIQAFRKGVKTVAGENGEVAEAPAPLIDLVGGRISDDELWSCTTCRACMEECPMFIEHIPTIVDMRRTLAMDESRFSPEHARLFNNLEASGNPFRAPKNTRADWAEGMGVKIVAEVAAQGEDIDVLYWVGCAVSHDDRNQKVARALTRTLQAAKVNFAILGREETCNGDPARRCGNEFLFQMLAQENVETMGKYKFNKIVTTCAHCFNTLKNEYPQFGGNYEVWHHTEYVNELVRTGQLEVKGNIDQTITYHDPCYIGRHNGVYDAPRELLNAIPGLNVVEMPRSGKKSFCCGGGGGQSFYEVKIGERINHMRTQEALDTNSNGIAAACPYCTLMFEDGVKAKGRDEDFMVQDVVELIDKSITAANTRAGS